MNQKYKKCCDIVCLVHGCEVRQSGGCVCVCNIVGKIKDIEKVIDGTMVFVGGGFIYHPNHEKTKEMYDKLSEKDKQILDDFKEKEAPQIVLQLKERLKSYDC